MSGLLQTAPECRCPLVVPAGRDEGLASLRACASQTQASRRAILNANYMAKRLENDYNVLYRSDAKPVVLSVESFLALTGANL